MKPNTTKHQSAGHSGWLTAIAASALSLILAACGGSSDGDSSQADPAPLAKAACSSDERPESGLQGQIPMAERTAGFKGFNCNLQVLSATQSAKAPNGERLFQQTAMMRDTSGRTCIYGGGAFLEHLGTVVIDVTDPSQPVETSYLTTPAMQNPGEGLKVHEGRGLLVSARYNATNPRVIQLGYDGRSMTFLPGSGTDPAVQGFDIYDVKTDCRHPQLLATTTALTFSTAGLPPPAPGATWPNPDFVYGHEGMFAPDGLTYYVSDVAHGVIHALDVADPIIPKVLGTFAFPYQVLTHGVSVTNDGNRGYFAQGALPGPNGMAPQRGVYHNGFAVVDTSEIQARKPNPKMYFISETVIRDGAAIQLPLQVKIKGKPYVIALGEFGTGSTPAGRKAACAAGLTPFSKVKIFDIENEQYPSHVSDITLEANDPKNCAIFAPEIDLPRPVPFVYDVHHCSVDNRDEATTLACGYFESGVRVYDIRDPLRVKEIAYFNPPSKAGRPGTGWCGSMAILDAAKGMVYSYCQDSGVLALKFSNGVWPLPGSSTPADRQL